MCLAAGVGDNLVFNLVLAAGTVARGCSLGLKGSGNRLTWPCPQSAYSQASTGAYASVALLATYCSSSLVTLNSGAALAGYGNINCSYLFVYSFDLYPALATMAGSGRLSKHTGQLALSASP